MRIRIILLVIFSMFYGFPAYAQNESDPIVGIAKVLDTDVIDVAGKRLFLFGIEAFEAQQLCFLNGKPWHCGQIAYRELQILVAEGEATCTLRKDTDRKRMRFPWATCTINGIDIAEEMVRRGMAMALREQSEDYIDDENYAELNKIGIWKGNFLPPWAYRDKLRGM